MADQQAQLTEAKEKRRSMYYDLIAMRGEMRENQDLKEELLENEIEMRRLKAELDAAPKGSPARGPRGSQGPMPEEQEPRRGGAFPWETPSKDRNEPSRKSHDLLEWAKYQVL